MSETMTERKLTALSDLSDYDVTEGYPDIRGWEVYSADANEIGKVKDLIVDTDAMLARYMVVTFKHGLFSRARHVIVPIGRARLDDSNDKVYLEGISQKDCDNLPDYDPAKLTPEFERQYFGSTAWSTANAPGASANYPNATYTNPPDTTVSPPVAGDTGFYNRPDYDSKRLFGARAKNPEDAYLRLNEERLDINKRPVQAGEVEVKKSVEVEHVAETVPVMHEQVTVERRPLAGEAVPPGVSVSEQEIRVPVMREEAEIGKRVVATEEVVIKKERVEGQQTVEADLKKEKVDVDKGGLVGGDVVRGDVGSPAAAPGVTPAAPDVRPGEIRKKEEV